MPKQKIVKKNMSLVMYVFFNVQKKFKVKVKKISLFSFDQFFLLIIDPDR